MRTVLSSSLLVLAAAVVGRAQESTLWPSRVSGPIDGGWVVTTPAGSSHYLSVAYTMSRERNVEDGVVFSTMPFKGVGVSVADFGTTRTYPTVGIFH